MGGLVLLTGLGLFCGLGLRDGLGLRGGLGLPDGLGGFAGLAETSDHLSMTFCKASKTTRCSANHDVIHQAPHLQTHLLFF